METDIPSIVHTIGARRLPSGGFGNRPGEGYGPDATAWSIMVQAGTLPVVSTLDADRSRLARDQLSDGRVPISSSHVEAFWPTPLAILAWQGSSRHRDAQARAVQFLLATTGRHSEKQVSSVVGHDTSLRGWPWIADTHSWVEPTAIVMMALQTSGYGDHPRVQEAGDMIIDRQLPNGGWNYGNTTVFGQELHPSLDATGVALAALAGKVKRESVQDSLEYATSNSSRVRSPIGLGWAILGLGAWGHRPRQSEEWIFECLERQRRYGVYDTPSLCLLLAALIAPEGLGSISNKLGHVSLRQEQ